MPGCSRPGTRKQISHTTPITYRKRDIFSTCRVHRPEIAAVSERKPGKQVHYLRLLTCIRFDRKHSRKNKSGLQKELLLWDHVRVIAGTMTVRYGRFSYKLS